VCTLSPKYKNKKAENFIYQNNNTENVGCNRMLFWVLNPGKYVVETEEENKSRRKIEL